MSLNFKSYREALAAAQLPIVPYLGLYPKDLTSLEENPTIVEEKLVNFEKMRTIRKIVNQLREYQLRSYPFQIEVELATYLKHVKTFTAEEAFKCSLEREPRSK